jgi:integrase/recombinase XerD
VKVRLYIRVRLANGKRQYADPVFAANGKLKPSYAVVNGNPEHHPEGVYYLRYLKHGKRVWENVGTDDPSAMTSRLKRERILAAQASGVEIPDEMEAGSTNGRDLNETNSEYLGEVKSGKSHKTHLAYSVTLREFVSACKSATLEELDRADVLAFIVALRERGIAPRTIANRVTYLKTFF